MSSREDRYYSVVRYTRRLGDAHLSITLHEPPGGRPTPPEAFVQDLWQAQAFDCDDLATVRGQALKILNPGELNRDGGPDFHGARLRLGSIEWHGDVEIHVCSSGWRQHGHDDDPRYNSTILHVTLYRDDATGSLRREDGSRLPELVLAKRLQTPLRKLLRSFFRRKDQEIPCARSWPQVPAAVRQDWIHELGQERLNQKTARLAQEYQQTPDLEALLQRRLFAGLGYAPNAEPMIRLAERLPPCLVRHLTDPLNLEALHLGAAGLLPAPEDLAETDPFTRAYAEELSERFERLADRFSLTPMQRTSWQFARLRPANFPPLRIAQAAAWYWPGRLLHRDPIGRLLHALHSDRPVTALRKALATRPGAFWETHLHLRKTAKRHDPDLGRQRRDTLIVNAVAPVLLLLAEQQERPEKKAHVLAVLEKLPAMMDRITRRFAALDARPSHALEAQGQHQLYRTRCQEARCLTCTIGQHILDRDGAAR